MIMIRIFFRKKKCRLYLRLAIRAGAARLSKKIIGLLQVQRCFFEISRYLRLINHRGNAESIVLGAAGNAVPDDLGAVAIITNNAGERCHAGIPPNFPL